VKESITPADLTFAVESAREFIREAHPLFVLHREEITRDKDVMILDVDEDYYGRNYDVGHIVPITARHLGRLVGYFVWHLHPHPHYKNVLCAQEDVHYLLPEYRRGMSGYRLMKNAKEMLKPLGVRYAYMREKIGHEHPAIMKRLGGKPLDITYSFRIE
jgi:GNAT superfamily N-acetyltransferase